MGLLGLGRWCVLTAAGWTVVAAGSARADCLRGTRPPTIPERTFQVETLTAIRAAMPAVPEGWRVVEATEVRPPRLACVGQERQPLKLDYEVRLRRLVLLSSGAGSADGGADEASADASILVEVNARDRSIPHDADALALDGVTLAFRRTAGAVSIVDLMFGDWSLEGDGERSSARDAHAYLVDDEPYTMVQSLLVRITGDPDGTEALTHGIKLDALKGLLYR